MLFLLNFGAQKYPILLMNQNIYTIKSVFFSFTVLLGFFFTANAQVKFYDGDYESLQQKARQEQKVYFIDFYTSWCGFCKKLDATTFRDPEFGEYANKYFIPFKLDAENGIGKKLAKEHVIKGYPTTLVFDSKGKLLDKISGYRDAYGFKAALHPFESKSKVKIADATALNTYQEIIHQDYNNLKKQLFNSSIDQFSQLKEQCISLGKNNKRFDFEELQLDTKLQYGTEKANELNLYYYLGKSDIEKIKSEIDSQRERNYITKDNLSFFVLHFILNLKPDIDVLRWTNELNLESKTKETLELKAYTQFVVGDTDDARETVSKLRKQYYKKSLNERVELLEKITEK